MGPRSRGPSRPPEYRCLPYPLAAKHLIKIASCQGVFQRDRRAAIDVLRAGPKYTPSIELQTAGVDGHASEDRVPCGVGALGPGEYLGAAPRSGRVDGAPADSSSRSRAKRDSGERLPARGDSEHLRV